MSASNPTTVEIPDAFLSWIFDPYRYKIAYGGRGGAKSETFATALVLKAAASKQRILCAREFQSSIGDSVHRTIVDVIDRLELQRYFTIQKNSISSITGSEFIFKGLRMSIQEIKSTKGITICWIEEAQSVSEDSWETLIPTIREEGSEIWISFNPKEETDPTYKRFVLNPPPGSVVRKINWQDNPWFPTTLDKERRALLATDVGAYNHVYGGECQQITDAVIFGKRSKVESFETPEGARFFFGADFGFANDPSVLIRCFTQDNRLYIDQEIFGYGVEIDELPDLYDRVPGSRLWPIKGDSSRPETISYLARRGFRITAAEKWPNSVLDGIAHLRGFEEIVIHERCKHMQDERRLYRFKTDPKTKEVLPVPAQGHDHGWDSVRYALDMYIMRRGMNNIWRRLAED